MPSQRKRIGFLPKQEIHDLIEKISNENNFSQSRVTGLLVEEALRSRGLLDSSLESISYKSHNKSKENQTYNNGYSNSFSNLNFSDKENFKFEEELEMINQFIEFKFFKKVINNKGLTLE